jgi:hypothetical protein
MLKEVHVEAFNQDLRSSHFSGTLARIYRENKAMQANLGPDRLLEQVRRVAIGRLSAAWRDDEKAIQTESNLVMGLLAADEMTWEGFCIGLMIRGAKNIHISVE